MRVTRWLAVAVALGPLGCVSGATTGPAPAPGIGSRSDSVLLPLPFRGGWSAGDSWTVVLQLDHATGRLRQAVVIPVQPAPCDRSALPGDSTFRARAAAFLEAISGGRVNPRRLDVSRKPTGFVTVGAFGGDVWFYIMFREEGTLVFAASRIWLGTGHQFYPSDGVPPWRVAQLPSEAPAPQQTFADPSTPDSLLHQVRRYNLVHGLARLPYDAVVWQYDRAAQNAGDDPQWIVYLTHRGACRG